MSRLCTGITAFPAARHRMAQKPLQLIPENVVLIFLAVSKRFLGDHLTQVPQLTFHPLSDLLGGATDLPSGLHGVKNLFHGYHLAFILRFLSPCPILYLQALQRQVQLGKVFYDD